MKKHGAILITIGLWGAGFLTLMRLVETAAITPNQRDGFMIDVTLTVVGLTFYLWPEKKP
jgi:hypothetical protein